MTRIITTVTESPLAGGGFRLTVEPRISPDATSTPREREAAKLLQAAVPALIKQNYAPRLFDRDAFLICWGSLFGVVGCTLFTLLRAWFSAR